MANDNPLSVNFPPVQWTTGSPARDQDSESAPRGEKKARKQPVQGKSLAANVDIQFEQAAPHEVDSFA